VPVAEARARARRLRALGEELAAAHARGFAGATVGVLVERIDAAGVARGYSERYLPVAFASAGGRAGDVVPVRLDPGAAACFPLPRGYLAGSAEPAADRAAGDAP
jgi:tRNA A37 methylthiotransferase MiaB